MSSSKFISLLILVFFLMVGLAPPTVQATSPPYKQTGISMTVDAGFDGLYKQGMWVPVYITVENSGAGIEGNLRITEGSLNRETIYDSPISLPTQSNKRITTYVQITTFKNRLTVELLDENEGFITSQESGLLRQLQPNDLLYGVVSPEPDELAFLGDMKGVYSNASVGFITLEQLPALATGWQALDILILNDVDSGEFSSEQRTALEQWLANGGQLVVTGGPGWQKTTTALADLLPVTVQGVESMADLPALSAYADQAFRDDGPYIVTTSSLRSGELLIHQDGLPLLARQSFGQGTVYFMALDPKLAPLVDWDGSEDVWASIVAGKVPSPFWATGVRNSYASLDAVRSLPSLALPSSLQLICFLSLYVLAIGPINYWILRRRQKREWAWVTIPALVLLFTFAAYIIGFQIKGNDIIVNQMSVVFGQSGNEQAQASTLMGIYSPRRATYDITVADDVLIRPFDRTSGAFSNANSGSVVRGNEVMIKDLRVDISDIQGLMAQSYQEMPAVEGQVAVTLEDSDTIFAVYIQNNSDLDIQYGTLIVGNYHVMHLGDLPAGDDVTQQVRLRSNRIGEALQQGAGHEVRYLGDFSSFSSPIADNYSIFFDTSDVYTSELEGKRSLLEAIHPNYNSDIGWMPKHTVTFVFWTDETLVDVDLDGHSFEKAGATVYFLELPFSIN